jgi:hypothetical protein
MKMSHQILSLTLLAMLSSACGKHQKNPVPDLDKMREEGKQEVILGPDKPKEIIRTIVVTQQVEVQTESNVVDSSFLNIIPDSDINFIEGKAASFNVVGRTQVPGAKVKLKAENLPAGVTFELKPTSSEKFNYALSWNPAYNTVPFGSGSKSFKIKIVAELEQAQGKDGKTAQIISNEKEVVIFVVPAQAAPTDVQVSGLKSIIEEGTETPFSITVVVPGIDDKSALRPTLIPSYDNVSMTPGNSFLELDATRHIVPDLAKKSLEYFGDFKWRFNLMFDTKNISVQPPLAADKQILTNAISSHVRMNFMVLSPRGALSPKILKQIEIQLDKPVVAPRFDFSGLNASSLVLKPGQKTTLIFTVSSADASSTVSVERPNVSTLVGAPTIDCKALASAKQECTLTWNVPAEATEADLTQELAFTAISSKSGKNSDPVKQSLKVSMEKPKEGGQ